MWKSIWFIPRIRYIFFASRSACNRQLNCSNTWIFAGGSGDVETVSCLHCDCSSHKGTPNPSGESPVLVD